MSNVVNLPCITRLDIPPDRILQEAMGKLESVVVIGYTKDGEYFASSQADGAEVVWLLERCKLKLLRVVDHVAE